MSLNFLDETGEFQRLLEALARGERSLKLSGVVDSAKPFFISFLARRLKKRIVYIRPAAYSLWQFEENCRFFFSQFSQVLGLGSLPPLSENPYLEVPASLDSVSSRMKFFYSLTNNPPSLVITNLFGLLKPFPCPEDLPSLFIKLEDGDVFGRDRLIGALREFGYSSEDIITSSGEYAWRGGIVDCFSPWESHPFRVEFSGDEVASIREFDPSTQRSVRRLTHILIPSLREFPASEEFTQEWKDLALRKAGLAKDDVFQKEIALKKGDFFPTFAFLSLVHGNHFVPFTAYFKDSLFVIEDFEEMEKEWREAMADLSGQYQELQKNGIFRLAPEDIFPGHLYERVKREAIFFEELGSCGEGDSFHFAFQSLPRFDNRIPFFLEHLKKLQRERERCYIYLSSQMLRQKMASLLSQNQIVSLEASSPFIYPRDGAVALLVGALDRGFRFPAEKLVFFSERDIFTEEKVISSRPSVKPFLSHFQDLKDGDYVVHTDYGIGIFKGLLKMDVDGRGREFIELVYRDDDKLFVPVEDLNLVQKFSKVGSSLPPLDKLGSINWQKTKARTKKAIEKLAKELLDLYAQRKALMGFSFSPEGAWQAEFDKTFEFEETEDQLRSVKEINKDMESGIPMDRLLCGDVGFGKTEVAIRAGFKAVMDGKQVAVLCPTTVLASQHLNTFRNRMVLFPVHSESLTRLQTKTQQKTIIEGLRKGLVDIVIGTHRLLSRDVEFHDLGLLIIDEEQRFGVNHKEKIKQMRANVDVLTLTATPIPRTLNMSLHGIRDISLIESPPKDRLAIHTVVTPFSPKLVASAIRYELNRGGQVYYIHNRIEDIDTVAQKIETLVPQAKVVVVHGKMSSSLLEKRMIEFTGLKYNVLVSTTIIENGIDIPLVNTLIVDRADLFGLAQLYQLRGRVGRSSRQAFSYFLVPPYIELTPLAKERLKALKEFSELGSGFRLAAKDLEIRGAGNLLGSQQHGYMEAVGFDYFMQLLDQTIKELRGEKAEEFKSEINLKVDIRIPEDYIPQMNLRLNLYKKISSVENLEELEKFRVEIQDRFGPAPPSVANLLHYGAVKFLAQKLKIETIDRLGNRVSFKFFPTSSADLGRMTRIVKKYLGSITPQGVMNLPLDAGDEEGVLNETLSILKEL